MCASEDAHIVTVLCDVHCTNEGHLHFLHEVAKEDALKCCRTPLYTRKFATSFRAVAVPCVMPQRLLSLATLVSLRRETPLQLPRSETYRGVPSSDMFGARCCIAPLTSCTHGFVRQHLCRNPDRAQRCALNCCNSLRQTSSQLHSVFICSSSVILRRILYRGKNAAGGPTRQRES